MTCWEWIGQRMPKFIRADTPYWEEVCNDIDNPLIEEIDVFKSAQIGLTRLLAAIFGYWGDTTSDAIMFGLPTDEKVLHEQRNKFGPWLEEVEGLVRSNRRYEIKFTRGGRIYFRSFEKSKALKSDSCRFIAGDEVDEAPQDVEGEGDPLKMMEARQIAQRMAKKIFGSTPKDANGHIARRDALAGEKREMWVNCPHCRKPQKLVWENLKWAKVEGKTHRELAAIIASTPGMVWYECLERCRILEAERLPMIAAAKWVSQTERRDAAGNVLVTQVQRLDEAGNVVGARPLSTAVSYRPWSIISSWFSWSKLVKVWLESCDDPNLRKSVLSQYMGRLPAVKELGPVVSGELTITQREAAKATAAPRTVPTWAALLIIGADTQGDRLYWSIRAFGRTRSQLVDTGMCARPEELLPLLDRQYPIAGTTLQMKVAGMAIDFGGTIDQVSRITAKQKIFTLAQKDARIVPVKGLDNNMKDVVKAGLDETYQIPFLSLHTPSITSQIFELRKHGLWELYRGVDSAYVASVDRVVETIDETNQRGFKFGERCDYFDTEAYSYGLFRYRHSKEEVPEEAVMERMRAVHAPVIGAPKPSLAQALGTVRGKPEKKW